MLPNYIFKKLIETNFVANSTKIKMDFVGKSIGRWIKIDFLEIWSNSMFLKNHLKSILLRNRPKLIAIENGSYIVGFMKNSMKIDGSWVD